MKSVKLAWLLSIVSASSNDELDSMIQRRPSVKKQIEASNASAKEWQDRFEAETVELRTNFEQQQKQWQGSLREAEGSGKTANVEKVMLEDQLLEIHGEATRNEDRMKREIDNLKRMHDTQLDTLRTDFEDREGSFNKEPTPHQTYRPCTCSAGKCAGGKWPLIGSTGKCKGAWPGKCYCRLSDGDYPSNTWEFHFLAGEVNTGVSSCGPGGGKLIQHPPIDNDVAPTESDDPELKLVQEEDQEEDHEEDQEEDFEGASSYCPCAGGSCVDDGSVLLARNNVGWCIENTCHCEKAAGHYINTKVACVSPPRRRRFAREPSYTLIEGAHDAN